ncbi:leucine-rich repeat-containing protein 41 [Spea bombifrons]|uniref:leucine-rich repeat-containing protein 41 n=1 Tax=Spea bombifrons TaxID=233779 RepID=UPI002349C5AA|nr:leucine-rich repeat-containing protein 41 [Spea bombifrons]
MLVIRGTQAMEKAVEDARGTPTLFKLCARAVTANMDRLEQDVWDLPAVILQGILPLLNIYYLERIEQAAVKKGLSTQSIWCKHWNDIMKSKPPRFGTVTCWRKKFLEAFFHNVLRGILDVSSDRRLNDKRFSPLVHSSRHVSELTISNKQHGVSQLTPAVLECLSKSVETLKFLHLRSSDPATLNSLKLLLHRLIHHGQVNKLSLLSWPAPDNSLLEMILCISAGFWQEHKDYPCVFCSKNPRKNTSNTVHEAKFGADLAPSVSSVHSRDSVEGEVGSQSALLSLQPLNISQNVSTDPYITNSEVALDPVTRRSQGAESRNVMGPNSKLPLAASGGKVASTSRKNLKSGSDFQGSLKSDPDDLYDFIFSVPKGEGNDLDKNPGYKDSVKRKPLEEKIIGMPFLEGAYRCRSVKALNLHNIPLTMNSCRSLCQLLRSWVSLERLTMAYNDLGVNIFLVVEALSALSRCPGCRLSVFSMSDFTAYVPTLHLAHTILTTFPSLQLLSLSFDLENHSENEPPVDCQFEFKENLLKQLEIRFPQDPLHSERLISILEASTSLTELSLDNATFPSQDVLRRVLRALTERNTSLRRLNLHDMKLTDTHGELVHLLKNSSLEEVKLSFCRLFERGTEEFFTQFVAALKKNPFLKVLNICGNRLGNDGLIIMADMYAPDSLSSIRYLDISSNCIKPDGLLQFAKKMKRFGKTTLRHLCISQNLLDRDPMMAREALQSLEGMCCVVSDAWESTQSFADHISVM